MFGILKNKKTLKVFDEINTKRLYCEQCRKDRISFSKSDKRHNDSFSNLLPGFSSSEIQIPLDVLVIADSHGGGRKETFRNAR